MPEDKKMTMKNRPFIYYKGSGYIQDDNFDYDAGITVGGDFGSPEVKDEYCQMITDALNFHSEVLPGPNKKRKSPYKEGTNLFEIINDGWSRGFELQQIIVGAKLHGFIIDTSIVEYVCATKQKEMDDYLGYEGDYENS